MLQICIGSICLVSATPPTVLGQSFWNFTGTLQLSFDFTWEICHLLDITAVAGHLAWLAVLLYLPTKVGLYGTVIVCNKNLKTDWISHSRWRFSHQEWIASKEDQWHRTSTHLIKTKKLVINCAFFVGINPELVQFLNLWMDFLFK